MSEINPLAGQANWRVYPDPEPVVVEAELVPLGPVAPVAPRGVLDEGLWRVWQESMSAGLSPENPLDIRAGTDVVTKEGRWTVPPYLRLFGGTGSIRLDFRLASVLTDVLVIDVQGSFGSILFIVPRGWAVRIDQIERSWGSCRSTVDEVPAPGCPVLICRGKLNFGSFQVRYASDGEERRLAKRLLREQARLR